MVWRATHISNNMPEQKILLTREEYAEFIEMKEFFRKVKYGSVVVIAFFSVCMAVGGAYLMVRSIALTK